MIERGSPGRKLFGLFSYSPKLRQNCSQVLWYNLNTKSEQQIRVYERGTEHEENQFGVNKRGDEILLETTQIKQRLPFIDLIRGITIIEMISYHFLWDLVYLYNADIPWYKSHGAYIWQQSICWTFILLAGFSWHLGKNT